MDIAIIIIIFIVCLFVMILVHELGHFVTAKRAGVKVEEFGIGFPPRLFGIKRGETVYSFNAIPAGAFVRLAGEDDPTVPRSLASKSPWTRLKVYAAGPL
ncbi:MAG: RIP metalloprotease RseP, partial [Chloroflexi bacterium CG08_land_8_20_14_0_20_45_12]